MPRCFDMYPENEKKKSLQDSLDRSSYNYSIFLFQADYWHFKADPAQFWQVEEGKQKQIRMLWKLHLSSANRDSS